MNKILISLALFLFSASVFADNCFTGPCEKSDLPTCGAKLKGREFVVKNCVSAASCASTASPGFAITHVCDYTGSAWAYRTTDAITVDLSAYVLLAGDADGQTIQGLTGNNKARIELSVGGDVGKAALIGGGATYGFIYAYADGVYGESPDELTSFDLYNGGLDLRTNGTAQFYGSTGTNLGSEGGWTTVIGTRVNITSLQTPPTNSNDTCTAGDTIDTATFHYFCAATNTWVRVAMATW